MALERRQLYRAYEEARNAGLASVCFGLIFFRMIVDKFLRKTKSSLNTSQDRNREVQCDFQDAIVSSHIRVLRRRFERSIEALECYLDSHPLQLRELEYLEDPTSIWLQNKLRTTDKPELTLHEALRWIAITFLRDLSYGRDLEIHLAILMCSPRKRRYLMPLFRFFRNRLYCVVTRFSVALLLWLQLVETNGSNLMTGVLLLVLCVDGVFCSMFYTLESRRIEVKTRGKQGDEKTITIPGVLHFRHVAAWSYMLLLALACCIFLPEAWSGVEVPASSNTVVLLVPLLVILQNEEIWLACLLFVEAISSAGEIAYIWFCLLLLLSGQSCVLLHGRFSTGDDFVDNQFQDFYHAVSTISVFLIDGQCLPHVTRSMTFG